jgi:hypothetical protein
LPQDVEPVVVLIHGPPEGMARAVDRAQYCIEGPCVAWPGAPTTALIRRGLPTLVAPLADGFVCAVDPVGDQQLCDVPGAEAEPEVQPHTVADDLTGETMRFVVVGRGWCCHALRMSHQTEGAEVGQEVDNAL